MSGMVMEVKNLTLDYHTPVGTQRAVDDVSFEVRPGEVLGIVGESGSGKSTVAYQLLGYKQPNARRVTGSVWFKGIDIASLDAASLQGLRGNQISFVPQNPTTALNPAMTVGDQIDEVLRFHKGLGRKDRKERFSDLMTQVGLGAIEDVANRYPHRLSGGQQQRIAIAMALACNPELVVLDEPTTGLDVTVQQQIIQLLKSLRAAHGVSMVYVTHDLPLLRQIADRLAVMYRGQLIEIGEAEQVFTKPKHPYARSLLASVPQFQATPAHKGTIGEKAPLLAVRNLSVAYSMRKGLFNFGDSKGTTVVHDVNLSIGRDETLALIGESGSGKSTIARALCGLVSPQEGTIEYSGHGLSPTLARRTAEERREIQYIFQNPDASLNPRMRVGEILSRPLDVFFSERGEKIAPKLERALADVQLDRNYLQRFPQELSGGERQRVAIARALIAEPSLLLCDEVLSALDVSVQARVLELLRELRARTRVSMLFISHDLGVVRSLADRVGVLYQGQLVEEGPTEKIYTEPQHPYTQRLLAAAIGIHNGTPQRESARKKRA